ncbi:MAG: hypothetical protein II886_08720, partial [Prevotella sp.]|nr:hypothetical protein [Prevotella sp.]
MKQSTYLKSLLAFLLLTVGASFAFAEDWTLDSESYGRTNLNESTYSWNSGWPRSPSSTNNTFNANVRKTGMFVVQKYTVNNLAAVKSLTLKLTGPTNGGTDALAIWSYGSTNPWPSSSNVAEVASAVNTIVGVSLNTTTGSVNTPLVDGGSNKTTETNYMTATFTISGDKLTTLKNSANGNSFYLLITNKTSEITTSDAERKFYSSGHETTSYRPTLTVTYDKVGVTYGDGTKTNYSSFEAARSAVATAAQDATIVVMEDQNITSRVNAITGKTINIVAGVDGVTLTNTASNTLSFLANASNAGTINVGSSDHTLIIKNSATTTNSVVEVSGTGDAAANAIINIENVTFKDITKTAKAENPDVNGLIKTNNSAPKVSLKNVTFDGCSVAGTDEGIVLCNANGMVTLSGGLTFNNCTGHNFRVKGRMEENSFTPSQVMTIYSDGIALGSSAVIKMTPANTAYYTLVNEDRCLIGKGNTSNEELVVSEAYTLSVPSTNATTLILPFATTIPEGVTAYTLAYTDGAASVKATQVETTLPVNTPVYISATGSEAGTKYKFNASTRATSATASNTNVEETARTSGALTGVYSSTNISSGYVLSGASFAKVTESTAVDAYKAYLTATETAPTPLTVNTSGVEYTITPNVAENGTLSVSPTAAGAGETITVTATPNDSYTLTALKYNDGSDHDISIETTPYTFEMPAANVTVSATFTAPTTQYMLTIGEMTNGKIQISEADAATTKYDANTELTLTAVSTNDSYEFDKWTSDGTTELTANEDNIISINGSTMNVKMTKDFTVVATFKEKSTSPTTYAITKADATNGSFTVNVSDAEVTEAASDATVTITVTPNTGYEVNTVTVVKTDETTTSVTVNGEGNSRSFTMPAYAVTVTVTFKQIKYTILKTETTNGSFTVNVGEDEVTSAVEGATVTISAIPAEGYELATLTYTPEGENALDIKESKQFTMPAKAVTITATFTALPPSAYLVYDVTNSKGYATLNAAVDALSGATSDVELEVNEDQTLTGRLTWNKAYTLTITPTKDIT